MRSLLCVVPPQRRPLTSVVGTHSYHDGKLKTAMQISQSLVVLLSIISLEFGGLVELFPQNLFVIVYTHTVKLPFPMHDQMVISTYLQLLLRRSCSL